MKTPAKHTPKKPAPQNMGSVKQARQVMGKLMQQRVSPRGKRG